MPISAVNELCYYVRAGMAVVDHGFPQPGSQKRRDNLVSKVHTYGLPGGERMKSSRIRNKRDMACVGAALAAGNDAAATQCQGITHPHANLCCVNHCHFYKPHSLS